MSLNFKAFCKAQNSYSKVGKRLTKFIGFNPSTIDHYGRIKLYNCPIDEGTSKKEILAIYSKYLQLKGELIELLKSQSRIREDKDFDGLLRINNFDGRMYFYGIPLDLSKDIDYYRDVIGGDRWL